MLAKPTQSSACWLAVDDIVNRWLAERQELLVKYCEVLGLTPFCVAKVRTPELLECFCEILVDYISFGHFEVYEQLVSEDCTFGGNGALLQKVYPKLIETTQVALDFNDWFDSQKQKGVTFEGLTNNLSKLGEALAERMELEDELIEMLHGVHAEEVAA